MISQLGSAPNLLTLLRLIFVPVTVIAVIEGKYGWALALFITAGITDGLDGLLARLGPAEGKRAAVIRENIAAATWPAAPSPKPPGWPRAAWPSSARRSSRCG